MVRYYRVARMSPPSSPGSLPGSPGGPPRWRSFRDFLRGPRLVGHQGFGLVVAIFIIVGIVFGSTFYVFMTQEKAPPAVPITFTMAFMIDGNGTFNVTSVSNTSYPWTGFSVNLTMNNFGAAAVPLAASGEDAAIVIGPNTYHITWLDRDGDGKVSVGDAFWVTGNHAQLPPLSYCKFSLIWNAGSWAAVEYWITSSSII